ncbi:hypothetical protein COW36_17415 [bacterium (Candidatus Blackallbacteria) CG17_big_fil_post_rev_8_21_14_2_50_48_46]|uniref:Uncharacterized protein n=1 Tax=bacterium (Candidatus Blackallbacteria) CG17_big_fil_post_rev_8_21_14_2_50_48_46 TaxID=2014261 RepID=A0A2M7G0G9_9BACT|nr:MAG: hypothetical protein COW64_01315 [bacterium (Candidatus Blackallbacteria) CG18_big_fil_WC_8_21_14_2_50_49_26]PIW15201.1 MAG: hypothetical protein COW36_17415 [bacterium (Candidatus Blackallbacteria) CG17_big_fil_post_rev_8_21_14_2_50_48_46]PIW44788.1 MAG: hypothetical protein COW20_22750 [bacterium (Candidatus Blackallbacteria) CG13_big_fil_rev_8_21_14_2_50_49_14]
MSALRVSLIKVLEHYLTPQQYKRYVKERKTQLVSTQQSYNAALRDLSIRDTEAAIFNLINVFENEPRHLPGLHLARTMLFGLNKLFHEAGGDLQRSKYPNINSWRQKMEKQIQELEQEEQRLRNEISQTETKRGMFEGIFGGSKRQQKIAQLKQRLQEVLNDLAQLQKKRTQAIKLVQIQEYANVVSLVLEVCMFPARYSWLAADEQKQNNDPKYQTQTWYG